MESNVHGNRRSAFGPSGRRSGKDRRKTELRHIERRMTTVTVRIDRRGGEDRRTVERRIAERRLVADRRMSYRVGI